MRRWDWLEAGVHIKAVADLLGHSSIAITGDVYGHTSRRHGAGRSGRGWPGGSGCEGCLVGARLGRVGSDTRVHGREVQEPPTLPAPRRAWSSSSVPIN